MFNKSAFHYLLLVFLLISLTLSACSSPKNSTPEQSKNITISGAFALYPMMTRWGEEYQKIHPEIRFDISAGGAGKGMADALSGAVDIGMVSRDITPEEEAKGAFWVAVTKDAVFVTINANNPVKDALFQKGITRDTLTKIFITGEIKTWGEVVDNPEITDEIHVYTRSDACGAAEAFSKYLGKKQEDLLGIGVYGDPGVSDAVAKDPLGIGYNNLGYAYDASSGKPVTGILILPIDVNENQIVDPEEKLDTKEQAIQAVASNHYPSPPARALNLVTKGKPVDVVAQFIQWILTDGQKYVGEAGYVQLPQEQLEQNLQKLK
ncbi:MAG: PstS family phosphate ABC transporter substrate-binding protein [Anaerolineales bacterium]